MSPLFIFRVSIFLTTVRIIATNTELTTSLLYESEKLVCNRSQAVNYLNRHKVNGLYGKDYLFTIRCTAVNNCNETCEWTTRCTSKQYGQAVYVGGVQSLYDSIHRNRYLAILCCNGTAINATCPKSLIESEADEYELKVKNKEIFKEMSTAHRLDETPWLKLLACTDNANVESTCGAEREISGWSYAMFGLFGLAGLGGLAFVGGGSPLAPCGCNGIAYEKYKGSLEIQMSKNSFRKKILNFD